LISNELFAQVADSTDRDRPLRIQMMNHKAKNTSKYEDTKS